ncbi:MAG: transporter substrate-binding domain-containing protein [Proteobacteria bacterium]|nr:transporter substrate-binding domain-containing protein [Pseudomonadota bacterium]
MLKNKWLKVLIGIVFGSLPLIGSADDVENTFDKIKARGKMTVCADPYSYPYSVKDVTPPGFDIEIMGELAKLGGLELEMYWADTGTRGGMSRALRNSILKGRCHLFAGVGDNGEDDVLMGQMAFTKAYMSVGYVMVTQNKASGLTIKEIIDAGIPIGVQMSTPIDAWLHDRGIKRALQADNARVMLDMVKGTTDAAIVFSHAPSQAKRVHPEATFTLSDKYSARALYEAVGADYVGEGLGQQMWDLKFVVRKHDISLLDFVNKGIETLTQNGTIARLVEKYYVPYFPALEE